MTGDLPGRVLSLHAPWAWAVLHAGKNIENRALSFPRSFLGEFWLHASLWPGTRKPLSEAKKNQLIDEWCSMIWQSNKHRSAFPVTTFGELDALRGCIVGRVTLTSYTESSASPWFVAGSCGLELRAPKALRVPVPAVGAQGWWFVKPTELAQLRGSL